MQLRNLISPFIFAAFVTTAQAAEPVRVGVLGVDNYQGIAYTALFNSPKAEGDLAGLKVTACYPDEVSPDIAESVLNYPKWKERMPTYGGVEMVDSIDELLKRCDCVMMMSLDGRKHLKQAEAVLKAGKRLYIARPLATTLADALKILDIAEQTGTPMFSSSQHRYSPGFIGMRNHPEVGKVLGCDVYGGYDLKSSSDDALPTPLHSIETLYTIMGPGCTTVACTSTPTAEVVVATWNDGRVATYRGIKEGKPKYSATVFGDAGVSTAGIYGHGVPEKGIVPTKDKYMGYEGIAVEMAKFFKGGPTPVAPAETREIFALLAAIEESRKQGGAAVRLDQILQNRPK